eukprot:COSAG06_NODE_27537_length_591_cov_0.941057_1_plen_49_part_10
MHGAVGLGFCALRRGGRCAAAGCSLGEPQKRLVVQQFRRRFRNAALSIL